MGSGYGGGYAPGRSSTRGLKENHDQAARLFGTSRHGWLGQPGRQAHVQVIRTANPEQTANAAFNLLSQGGQIMWRDSGRVKLALFAPETSGEDMSAVTYRQISRMGDPAVDIKITGPDGFSYKIHFERER